MLRMKEMEEKRVVMENPKQRRHIATDVVDAQRIRSLVQHFRKLVTGYPY